MNEFTRDQILDAMIDCIWDEYGDSFMSACIYDNKDHFLDIFKERAINKIHEKEEKQREEIRRQEELTAYGKCPECGKQMVKRSGPYGDFLGCSGYPKCQHKGKLKDVRPIQRSQIVSQVLSNSIEPKHEEQSKFNCNYDIDDEEMQTFGDIYPQALGWGKDTFI